MKLTIRETNITAKNKIGELYLCSEEDIIISPNSVSLLTTGLSFDFPDGYKFDIELVEDLSDSDIILLAKTISHERQGKELGLIVSNCGRKTFRIDDGTLIATYSLIKKEKIEFMVKDDL